MKATIVHESRGRLRLRLIQRRMTLEQADLLEAYLQTQAGVTQAAVHERTCCAVIRYTGSRAAVLEAVARFRYDAPQVLALAPLHSSRALNRQYQEKLVGKVLTKAACALFLPAPLQIARVCWLSVPFLRRGLRRLLRGQLRVELLDALSIGLSMARRDFGTAGSVMFLLELGELLEEWTHKKSVDDLARCMSLNVDRVWLKTADGEVLTPISQVMEGGQVIVRMGGVIPLDGRVAEGEVMVNQASLTGESVPAEKDAQAHRQAIDQLSQRSGESQRRADQLRENIETLRQRSQECRDQIADTRRRKEECQQEIQRLEEQIRQFTAQRMEREGEVTEQTRRSRQITEQRESLSREISRLDERKKALETEYDQTIARLWEEYELTLSDAEALCVPFESTAELRSQVAEVRAKIRALGNVNVAAIDEYAEVSERYEFLLAQVKDVEASKAQLNKLIAELCQEMENLFTDSFARINQNFGRIFAELFGGGSARLTLTDPQDVLSSGIEIQVSPPGKIIKNLSALSGGEQSLVAISIYFAIFAVNPAPFCILDEIEAALDDVNVVRFAQYLRRIADSTQFIVITHRRGTMEAADVLYGVTMQEDGVSKILRLDLNSVSADLIS